MCQANLGLALLKGGKPAEALPVLQEALHIGPKVPVMSCLVCLHTCLALAELGRWDEAHAQFRVAEEAAGGLSKAQRAGLAKDFEQYRQKLEQQPRDKPKPEGLTESRTVTFRATTHADSFAAVDPARFELELLRIEQ